MSRCSELGRQHPRFSMALLPSFLTALVVISFGPGGSLGCNLPPNRILLSSENLELLEDMNRIAPYLCLDDRKTFRFPQEVVDGSQVQKTQAISVLYEMLWQTCRIFLTKQSFAAWNTTLLDRLQNILHRKLEALDTCLVEEMEQSEPALGKKDPTLAVKRYFLGIRLYLKQKKYSDCAWEIVRDEVRNSLSLLTSLQESLRKKDGGLGSPGSDSH